MKLTYSEKELLEEILDEKEKDLFSSQFNPLAVTRSIDVKELKKKVGRITPTLPESNNDIQPTLYAIISDYNEYGFLEDDQVKYLIELVKEFRVLALKS